MRCPVFFQFTGIVNHKYTVKKKIGDIEDLYINWRF